MGAVYLYCMKHVSGQRACCAKCGATPRHCDRRLRSECQLITYTAAADPQGRKHFDTEVTGS